MPTAFSRSMRSLAVERFSPTLVGLLLATGLLGGWITWFLLSRVAVYVVSQTARLEVDRPERFCKSKKSGRAAKP